MLMVLRPRLVWNNTAPGASANSVSSPPRPTASPGWKCVPRCRTMISPALTTCPPYRLTPRRWALESRPFRLEDAPFLCAMSDYFPVSMPVTRSWVRCWRCPCRLRYPVFFLYLRMLIFGPLVWPTTSAVTATPDRAAASEVTASPSTTSRAGSATPVPGSPGSFSTVMTSPTVTLCCLPPVRTIAYTLKPLTTSTRCSVAALPAQRHNRQARRSGPSTDVPGIRVPDAPASRTSDDETHLKCSRGGARASRENCSRNLGPASGAAVCLGNGSTVVDGDTS